MDSISKTKVLLCLHCGNKTQMESKASYQYHEWYDEVADYFMWDIYLCPVCHKITLEQTYSFSEDIDLDGKPIVNYSYLYPQVDMNVSAIPANLKSAFESALKVRYIDGAICALSLRRTLEMMCKDKGGIGKDLYEKLENLANKNILPPILNDMATILRRLGNAAAHADDADFSSDIVNSMIDFTETILEYVYVLPDKLTSIQKRLSKEVAASDEVLISIDDQAVIQKYK